MAVDVTETFWVAMQEHGDQVATGYNAYTVPKLYKKGHARAAANRNEKYRQSYIESIEKRINLGVASDAEIDAYNETMRAGKWMIFPATLTLGSPE